MTPTRTPETPSAEEVRKLVEAFDDGCRVEGLELASPLKIALAAIEDGYALEAGVVTKPCPVPVNGSHFHEYTATAVTVGGSCERCNGTQRTPAGKAKETT
jgi:hypothetical protein